jgi:hypothetical protein
VITLENVWDLDGTIFHSVFELDYFGYVERFGGEMAMTKFNKMNKIVKPSDVKIILTARPNSLRNIAQMELKNHGFDLSKIDLFMGSPDIGKRFEDFIEFKIRMLNGLKCEYYIDDDAFIRNKLQPSLIYTECISTDQFYGRGSEYPLKQLIK